MVHTVAQTIHVKPPRVLRDGSSRYDVGMRFVFLDERDRDLIFKQISAAQIDHLRKVADKREDDDLFGPTEAARMSLRQIATRAAWTLALGLIAWALVRYFVSYNSSSYVNPIEKTYENSIRKYRHLDR